MRNFAEPVRARGPVLVWEGPRNAEAIVVLDPTGAAKHGELPATWRPLAGRRQVVWCRLPAVHGPFDELADVLSEIAGQVGPAWVVTSGPVAREMIGRVSELGDLVRAVLLVDPEMTVLSDIEGLADTIGVHIEVVARSRPGLRDRVEPPLPLGHPDVVSPVARIVLASEPNGGSKDGVHDTPA